MNDRKAAALPNAPLHSHVRTELLHRIETSQWRPGEAVPGEVELAADLGVSVGTLRRALDDLVSAGLLERRRRRGTIVTAHTQDLMRDRYFHVVRRADLHKAFPTHLVVGFKTGAPDRLVREVFSIDEPVHEIESVAAFGGNNVLFDRIYVPQSMAPDLTREIFSNKTSSAFALWQLRYGVTVFRARETVEATKASSAIARRLGLVAGDPVLEIRRTAFTLTGRVVEFRRRWLHSGEYVYLHDCGGQLPASGSEAGQLATDR